MKRLLIALFALALLSAATFSGPAIGQGSTDLSAQCMGPSCLNNNLLISQAQRDYEMAIVNRDYNDLLNSVFHHDPQEEVTRCFKICDSHFKQGFIACQTIYPVGPDATSEETTANVSNLADQCLEAPRDELKACRRTCTRS